jgi:putative oxidoreductase
MKALLPIFKTGNGTDTLLLRLVLGVVMFPHGAQKVLGWFGGYGFSGTMTAFTQQMHIPALFAFLAIAAEFAGALGLIVGLTTRVAAFGVGVTMAVAATMHWQNGFFMNWYGNQKGEGFEYHLLAIGIAVVLMIKGGGRFSLDRILTRKLQSDSEVNRREELVPTTVS